MSAWERIKTALANPATTNWALAVFTGALVAVAIYQYIVLSGQLRVMREDERAWIALTERKGKEPRVVFDPVIKTAVVLEDTGKTPARHVFANLALEVVKNGELPTFRPPADAGFSRFYVGYLARDNPIVIPIDRWRVKESEAWVTSADERKALTDGTAWVAVFGHVSYDDVFGANHRLHWCNWWSPIGKGDYIGISSCAAFNDEEDSK